MPTPRTGPAAVARLRHLADPTPDADLLVRFVRTRDDRAFAELVRRHGPTVLAVCTRITGDPHDADDAFQATFLVLARKADRVRPAAAVGAFVYGVAVKAARAALARACRRRDREVPVAAVPDVPQLPSDGPDPDAVRAVLDEVARLSEAYRSAVVLCELEGRSRSVAARQLGIAEGTLSSRLAAARKVLADRLRRRGLAPAAVLAAVAADVPMAVAVSEVPSQRVHELAEAVMRTTALVRWKAVAAAVAVAAVGLAAAGEPDKPVPPAPKRAPDESRLVLGLSGEVRYLTPDGAEVARVTDADAVNAGADMPTRAVMVGVDRDRGLHTRVTRTFAPHGRTAPDGRLPLATNKGLHLLSAGPPLAVRPVTAAGKPTALFHGSEAPRIVAWSPDGRTAIGVLDTQSLFGGRRITHTRIDVAAGTAQPFTLPAEHRVVDWAPDGTWFLTVRTDGSSSLFGAWRTQSALCRVTGTGEAAAVEELAPAPDAVWNATLSPDGKRVAYTRPVTSFGQPTTGAAPITGFEVVVVDLTSKAKRVLVREPGEERPDGTGASMWPGDLRWSPDGTRVGCAYYSRQWRLGPQPWERLGAEVVVATVRAAGGPAREVFRRDVSSEVAVTLFDWR